MPTSPASTAVSRCRQRWGTRLLRTAVELAIDRRELEDRLNAADPDPYSSAHGAVAMARWVDLALLWLAWRIAPSTLGPQSGSAGGRS
jgi:hypothetical protein